MHLPLSANVRPPLPTSRQGNSVNFTLPMPPVPTFPCTGITPPHPHPVAPFPPPPRSYAALQHGPVPLTPLPPVCATQLQPFFTLATTHLPPNIRPRPLPHPLPSSPYHQSPTPATSLTVIPGREINARPVLPLQTSLQQPPLQPPLTTTLTRPRPLRSPHAATMGITCTNCGHYNMLVDLSGGQLRQPLPAHPVATIAKASPPMFQRPSHSHPLPWPPPTQHPGSAFTVLPRPVTSRGGGVFSPLCRALTSKDTSASANGNSSSKARVVKRRRKGVSCQMGQGVSTQLTTRIIPYRERKKETSLDVYARQSLELQFTFQQKPTVVQMAEIAAKLGVSKEFVRQWFSNRRRRQEATPPEASHRTIPSGTHDITVEIPADEGAQNSTVVVSPS